MRVAVFGAGAMGTLLGHGFCQGGHEVTLVDLPDRIAQLRAVGKLVVIGEDGAESAVAATCVTSDYAEVVSPDVILLATKSQDLPAIAEDIAALAENGAAIVTIQNGIPWWYLQGLSHGFGNVRINCLDPDGRLQEFVRPSQIVGGVAYPAAILESDGRVRHVEGRSLPVGALDGSANAHTQMVSELLHSGGFKSRIIDDIRSEIWLKAWGALSINPISALTRATMEDICTFPDTRDLVAGMMHEAQAVAEAFGATFRHTIDKRINGAKAVGAHKTSMLQDVENGRSLELDGLMRAVLDLAEMANKDVPTIRSVYACTALLNENLG